jgi:hypothetical protein
LDPDDGFGVFQPLTQPGIFTAKLVEIGVCGLGDLRLGAAPQRFECREGACISLAAPVGQSRRVKAFTAQDGGDPAGIGGAVGLRQDAQLGRRGERPAPGPWREFGRPGRRWRHRRRLAACLIASSVRQFDWAICVGRSWPRFRPRSGWNASGGITTMSFSCAQV